MGKEKSGTLKGSRSVSNPKGDAPRASYSGGRSVEAQGLLDCRPANSDRKQSAK